MKILVLISLIFISCTSSTKNTAAQEKKTRDSINAIINFDDSIMENVEDSETYDTDTTNLELDKIGIYGADVSLQQEFVSIDGATHSLWSALQNTYANEEYFSAEEYTESEGNSLTDVEIWQNLYTTEQGDCSARSVILLKRTDDFTSISFDLIFLENDNGKIKGRYQEFTTSRDNTKEQAARIVTGYSLSDNCETLAIEYFEKGEDEDDKWSKRTFTFYIASERSFLNLLEIELENNTEFYKDQDTVRRTSTCSFDILPQKTNGLHDIKVICQTEKDSFTKIYRYNGKLYLDN